MTETDQTTAPAGTDGDPGWDTPGQSGDESPDPAGTQHPRSIDAEHAEGATDSVERDSAEEDDATGVAVKQDVGDDGWATQSGAQDDDGALGQD